MSNPLKKPRYKKGDRVMQRKRITLITDKEYFKNKHKKYYKSKRGIIVNDPYLDKPDKAGSQHYVYDVQWDGRLHTDPVKQNVIALEENK